MRGAARVLDLNSNKRRLELWVRDRKPRDVFLMEYYGETLVLELEWPQLSGNVLNLRSGLPCYNGLPGRGRSRSHGNRLLLSCGR
jgi:hypothetical protein